MPLSIKLPPHNENALDQTLLRGNDEDYFVKRMKKLTPERIDETLTAPRRGRSVFSSYVNAFNVGDGDE